MKKFIMKSAWYLYYLLPPSARQFLKNILKGGGGHMDSSWGHQIAFRDANGKMSLKNSVDIFCDYLDCLNIESIENKDCLEIGTGYVGTHSLVMWLLGAKSVTAMDLNKILVPKALHAACKDFNKYELSVKLKSYVTNIDMLNSRIENLHKWSLSESSKEHNFFIYEAPFNILKDQSNTSYDFIFSISVLEHIPPSIVEVFIETLYKMQRSNSSCMHFIDLTDHYDHENNPLGFLSTDHIRYNENKLADSRGNRIRSSHWLEIFNKIYLIPVSFSTTKVKSSLLPEKLLMQFKGLNHETLLDKSILIGAKKR